MMVGVRPASRDQALSEVREFFASNGRLPSQREWAAATVSRPCARTIERRWGWRELLAEAVGISAEQIEVQPGRPRVDRDLMLEALRGARTELGRWPIAEEWLESGRRPSTRTFVRSFGSWDAACRAAEAGDEPARALR
jgi:hypothetical protein